MAFLLGWVWVLVTCTHTATSFAPSRSISRRVTKRDVGQRIFFDVAMDGQLLGRLVFRLVDEPTAPLRISNILKLCSNELLSSASVDLSLSFKRCAFDHSPETCEMESRYRWAHTLRGRGRNAVGEPKERLTEAVRGSHAIGGAGGGYYGARWDAGPAEGGGVVLAVPLAGPGRGTTQVQFVRVGDSPKEWRERLLLNSAVLGHLESGLNVVRAMARQRMGPPVVEDSGVLSDID